MENDNKEMIKKLGMKNRKTPAQEIGTAINNACNVSVCDQTIRNCLNEGDIYGKVPKMKTVIPNYNNAVGLKFVNENINKVLAYY